MRRLLPRLLTACVVATLAAAPSFAQTREAGPSVEDALKALRADLQGARADIMAKNVSLTAQQAAKFWPLFETYQKEQNAIIDEQMKGVQKFADSYEKMSDADALALMTTHLERDAKMTALRQKWLPEFQKVLPTKLAVRVMQIDRRLGLATQVEITSRIPLAH